MLSIQFIGAAGVVTGSCYAVTYGQHTFLIDCGMFQGEPAEEKLNYVPTPLPAAGVVAVLLTHAHIDHSGLLPRLSAAGFKGRVLCTPPTRSLCDIMLLDSAKIQEQDAATTPPLYDRDDALDVLELMEACDYDQRYRVCPGCTVRFRDAGHILGSAWLELEFDPLPEWNTDQPVTVVFSGDVGRGQSPILPSPVRPRKADFLVLESTYGDRLHPTRPPEDLLCEAINEASDEGTALVIPAFAVQRTQDLACLVEQLWEDRRIDGVDLFIDSPMAVKATRVYEEFPEHLTEEAEEKVQRFGQLLTYRYLKLCETSDQSRAISAGGGAQVIISASGMAEGGRVLHHLRRHLPNPRAQVLLAGYQCENTRGWKLQQGVKSLEILGGQVPVRARVRSLQGLSGHADYAELQDWLGRLDTPPRCTFLTHGDGNARPALREKLAGWRVELPGHRERWTLMPAPQLDTLDVPS